MGELPSTVSTQLSFLWSNSGCIPILLMYLNPRCSSQSMTSWIWKDELINQTSQLNQVTTLERQRQINLEILRTPRLKSQDSMWFYNLTGVLRQTQTTALSPPRDKLNQPMVLSSSMFSICGRPGLSIISAQWAKLSWKGKESQEGNMEMPWHSYAAIPGMQSAPN